MAQPVQANQEQVQCQTQFQKPSELNLPRPKGRVAWFLQRSAYSRLFRDFETFRAELALRGVPPKIQQPDWHLAAQQQMENVEKCLKERDIEGGWRALHAAQRFVVLGLTPDEL